MKHVLNTRTIEPVMMGNIIRKRTMIEEEKQKSLRFFHIIMNDEFHLNERVKSDNSSSQHTKLTDKHHHGDFWTLVCGMRFPCSQNFNEI